MFLLLLQLFIIVENLALVSASTFTPKVIVPNSKYYNQDFLYTKLLYILYLPAQVLFTLCTYVIYQTMGNVQFASSSARAVSIFS